MKCEPTFSDVIHLVLEVWYQTYGDEVVGIVQAWVSEKTSTPATDEWPGVIGQEDA